MGIWQRYLDWRHRQAAGLLLTSEGFTIQHGRDSQSCRWADVRRITAFKRDLYSYDCICILMLLNDETVQVDEGMDGFSFFRDALERRFGVAPDWWAKVAFPAFDICEHDLYVRSEEVGPC